MQTIPGMCDKWYTGILLERHSRRWAKHACSGLRHDIHSWSQYLGSPVLPNAVTIISSPIGCLNPSSKELRQSNCIEQPQQKFLISLQSRTVAWCSKGFATFPLCLLGIAKVYSHWKERTRECSRTRESLPQLLYSWTLVLSERPQSLYVLEHKNDLWFSFFGVQTGDWIRTRTLHHAAVDCTSCIRSQNYAICSQDWSSTTLDHDLRLLSIT